MKPLFYIMRKSFVNNLKRLKKKPLYLISYIFLAVFIGFFLVASFIMPSNNISRGSASIFNIIASIFVLATMYFQINQGIEKGSSFFRQADVNFVFTAPISPKKVLVYGFIKQMYSTLLIVVLLAFQIPNLKNHFSITKNGVLIIYIAIFTLFFMMSLLSLIIYTITSKSTKRRKTAKKVLTLILVALLMWFFTVLIKEKDALKAAQIVFNSNTFDFIPIIGWFKVVLSYALKPVDSVFFYNIGLIIITIAIFLIGLYKMDTDYYEDVLAATERKEQLTHAKKEGRQIKEIKTDSLRKVKQNYGSGGAKAIFYRQMIEYKKSRFVFLDRLTITNICFGIGSKYFFPNANMKTVLYFTIYMLFIFSMQGKWIEEIKKPYIYLIPDTSIKKVFYGTLSQHIKNLIDGIILFSIAGFMFKADIVVILLCAITYMSFGSIFVYIDVLARRIFGSLHSRIFKVVMKLLLIFFIILPGIIGSLLIENLFFAGVPFINYFSYMILIAYNILIASLLLLAGRKIFEVAELD